MLRLVRVERIPLADIAVGKRWREPTAEQVQTLRDSIRGNGLLVPIGVRLNEKGRNGASSQASWILVHGATRLAAADKEGWRDIEAQILEGSDAEFEMAELAENLHRGELTMLQRDMQFARYVELCASEGILRGDRAKIGRGRPEGGLRAAARTLGLAESTARDAMKAANMTPSAAAVVDKLGLADNPTAYRSIADEPTTRAQIAKAREIVAKRKARPPKPATKSLRIQLAALVAAWKKAKSQARKEFLRGIGHEDCSAKSTANAVRPRRSTGRHGPNAAAGQLEIDLNDGVGDIENAATSAGLRRSG